MGVKAMKTIEPVACKHTNITAYRFADTLEPAGLWGCADCNTRFEPTGKSMERIKELEELVGTPSFEGDTPAMHLANSMQFGAEMVDKYSKLNKRIKELEAEIAALRKGATNKAEDAEALIRADEIWAYLLKEDK